MTKGQFPGHWSAETPPSGLSTRGTLGVPKPTKGRPLPPETVKSIILLSKALRKDTIWITNTKDG